MGEMMNGWMDECEDRRMNGYMYACIYKHISWLNEDFLAYSKIYKLIWQQYASVYQKTKNYVIQPAGWHIGSNYKNMINQKYSIYSLFICAIKE